MHSGSIAASCLLRTSRRGRDARFPLSRWEETLGRLWVGQERGKRETSGGGATGGVFRLSSDFDDVDGRHRRVKLKQRTQETEKMVYSFSFHSILKKLPCHLSYLFICWSLRDKKDNEVRTAAVPVFAK